MKWGISMLVLGLMVVGFSATKDKRAWWNEISWHDVGKALEAENFEETDADYLTSGEEGSLSPTLAEAQATIEKVKKLLKGNVLICTNRRQTKSLMLKTVDENANSTLLLYADFGYGTPSIDQLDVNASLTTFYFGEEPNDLVVLNSDLKAGLETQERPSSCEGFSHASFINTGDIGIAEWGIRSTKAACCLLKR